ncbi:MAG: Spy/CpxP family protein refolding chaperone [Acidobacteriota bacterium]
MSAKKTLAFALASSLVLTFAVTSLRAGHAGEGEDDSFLGRAHHGLHSLFQRFHGHGGHGHGEHGRRGHGHGGFAAAHGGAHFEALQAHVEETLQLTPDQTDAWQELTTAMHSAHESLTETLHALHETAGSGAPQHLDALEQMLQSGLDTVREVRPSFDTFYDTLSDEQRSMVDEMMHHHGH